MDRVAQCRHVARNRGSPQNLKIINLTVVANEKASEDFSGELDCWIPFSEVRAGRRGLAANIKYIFEELTALPDRLHIVNDKPFHEKGTQPSREQLHRVVEHISRLTPGSIAVWMGSYNARLYVNLFQHERIHDFFENDGAQKIHVLQDTANVHFALLSTLNDSCRQAYSWPIGKFKVVVCRNVLHVGTSGHLAHEENPVTPCLQLAMRRILPAFLQHCSASQPACCEGFARHEGEWPPLADCTATPLDGDAGGMDGRAEEDVEEQVFGVEEQEEEEVEAEVGDEVEKEVAEAPAKRQCIDRLFAHISRWNARKEEVFQDPGPLATAAAAGRKSKAPPPAPRVEVTEAYWPDDDMWLPAKLLRVSGIDTVDITWLEDGSESTVPADYVR